MDRGIDRSVRVVSSALFNNEKTVEVVLELEGSSPQHAQAVSTSLGIGQPVARSALMRLAKAGLVTTLPRPHVRAALYFEPVESEAWRLLVALCRQLATDATPGTMTGRAAPDAAASAGGTADTSL